jgi:hypothetical protein
MERIRPDVERRRPVLRDPDQPTTTPTTPAPDDVDNHPDDVDDHSDARVGPDDDRPIHRGEPDAVDTQARPRKQARYLIRAGVEDESAI